ncbi:MAG: tRNA 2-thiouridine(34) synthase MnmA [Lactobacillales bacterium]|jgi:tRNA-specific 2-thiouridylase|nr:tRNA 2-thiouridine(34) synthase MnmA [Lactobacillales bacterium]
MAKNEKMQKTVAVGLSGGVDSTLAALLLKEQGYKVIGLSMSIYNKDIPRMQDAGKCCYGREEKQDIKNIQEWCRTQGIESHIIDVSEEFKKTVLTYFKETYLRGITPNPCIKCNTEIKFGLFLEKASQLGIHFDYFATGHYARIFQNPANNRFVLKRGVDLKKDQSYFLYRLTQAQLSKILFPLGELTKEMTREMARERGIPVADKTDSQDFYSGDYADLLEQNDLPGDIVHINGQVLGKHLGFWHYTIGQRKGLGVAYKTPLFVIDIDAESNQVIVGDESDTLAQSAVVGGIVLGGVFDSLPPRMDVHAKYRSAGKLVPATVSDMGQGQVRVDFDSSERSLTPGQSIVFYQDDDVIGGGIILKPTQK